MLKYCSDLILLGVICSIPYFVTSLRLRSGRSRKSWRNVRLGKGHHRNAEEGKLNHDLPLLLKGRLKGGRPES